MEIKYFKFWNWGEAKFPLKEYEAKKFHLQQKPYVAVLNYNNNNYVVSIDFNMEGYFCSSYLLNEFGNDIVLAAYQLHEGNLFLRNVQMRKYDENQEPIGLIGFVYELDGRYKKVVIDEQYNEEVTYGKTNVDHHFRDMIQFGKYESILDGIEGFLDEA